MDKIAYDCKIYNSSVSLNYLFGGLQSQNLMIYNGLYNNNSLEYNWETITYTASNLVEMTQRISGDTITININGEIFTKSTGTSNGERVYIGACNGGSRVYTGMRIYYFKMYNRTSIVRDYIPVQRKSDGAIGLYDRVSGTFFGNSGTGSFGGGLLTGEKLVDFSGNCGQTGWYDGRWTQRFYPTNSELNKIFQYGTKIYAKVRFESLTRLEDVDINDVNLVEGRNYFIEGNEITIEYTITSNNLIGEHSFIDFNFTGSTGQTVTVERFEVINPARQDFTDHGFYTLTDYDFRFCSNLND